jgi:hypothetical protein
MLTTEELNQIAEAEDVPLSLLLARYHVESSSGTNPKANVPQEGTGIVGPFQMSPATFQEVFPGGNIKNEYHNAVAAARYLKQGLDKYGGDYRKANLYFEGGPDESIWGPRTNAGADKAMAFLGRMEETSKRFSESIPVKAALSVSKEKDSNMAGTLDYTRLVDQISGDTNAAIASLATSQQAAERFQAEYNAAAKEKTESLSRYGTAEQVMYSAIAAQQNRKATGVLNTLGNMGLDNESMNNLQAFLTTKMARDTETLIAARGALTEKADKIPQPLANPLGWLIGSFGIREDISKHNNLLGTIKQDKQLFDMLLSSAHNLEAVNNAKSAVGEASKAIAQGTMAAAKVDELKAEIAMTGAKTGQVFATREFENQMQVLSLRRAHLALLEAVDAKHDRDETKQAKLEAEAADLASKNSALKMAGYEEVNSMAAFNKLPKHVIAAAEIIRDSGGTKFGNDFVEAYQTVKRGDPRRQTGDTKAMVTVMDSVYKKTLSDLQTTRNTEGKAFTDLKPEQQRQLINFEIEKDFNEMQMKTTSDGGTGTGLNPYAAPPVKQILEDPKFAPTKLAEILKNTQKITPALELTPETVIAIAKAELANGANYSLVEQAANDLQMYFARIMALNNQAMSFDKYNLPVQEKYGIDGKDWSKRNVIVIELSKTQKMIDLRDVQLSNVPGA